MLITPLGATTVNEFHLCRNTNQQRKQSFLLQVKTQKITKRQPTMPGELKEPFHILTMNRLEWNEFTERYEEDIEASVVAPNIESLGTSTEESSPPNIEPEDEATPEKTASANQTMSPKALWLAIENAEKITIISLNTSKANFS